MSFLPTTLAAHAPARQVPEIRAEDSGHMALICVAHPLDAGHTAPLQEQARRLAQNCRCLVVDLGRTEFIDSSGVRALLQIAVEVESNQRELRLVLKPGSRVEHTFKLLRLLQRFQVFPNLEAAWRSTPSPTAC